MHTLLTDRSDIPNLLPPCKRLNIKLIRQIKKAAGTFLTLHGGSGTDDRDLRNAIAAGIASSCSTNRAASASRNSLAEDGKAIGGP